MTFLWGKRCPRCEGQLFLEDDAAQCSQCSHKFELDTLKEVRPRDPRIIDEQIRQENLRDWGDDNERAG